MDRDSAKTIGRIFAKYLTVLTTHAAHLGVTLCSFATLSTFLQELQLELSSFALCDIGPRHLLFMVARSSFIATHWTLFGLSSVIDLLLFKRALSQDLRDWPMQSNIWRSLAYSQSFGYKSLDLIPNQKH